MDLLILFSRLVLGSLSWPLIYRYRIHSLYRLICMPENRSGAGIPMQNLRVERII